MKSEVNTPAEYVSLVPADRQKSFKKIRTLIRKSLPKGYKETIEYGMISYQVPEKKDGSKPVSLNLANQKSYMTMYFSNIYDGEKGEAKFRKEYEKDGHKLNMGKSCLRFKKDSELNLVFLEKLLNGKFHTPFK